MNGPPSAADAIPTRLFSTDGVPPAQRHDYWQSVGWPSVGRMYEYRADPGFAAQSRSVVLDRLSLSVGHYGAQVVERDPAIIRSAPVDHLLVSMPLDAPMATDAGLVAPGGAVMLDLAQPWRHRSERGSMAVIGLPRSVALEYGIDPRAVHGAIVPAQDMILLRDHALKLLANVRNVPAAAASRLSRTIVDLLAVSLIGKIVPGHPPEMANDEIYKERACRFVAASLTQSWLNAEHLAGALGISRSSLYRLFLSDGGVQRYIRQKRLLAARAALADSAVTIGEVASRFQFTDTAHFARAFRALFGMNPSDWRAAQRDASIAGSINQP